jgi:hypothetical protein
MATKTNPTISFLMNQACDLLAKHDCQVSDAWRQRGENVLQADLTFPAISDKSDMFTLVALYPAASEYIDEVNESAFNEEITQVLHATESFRAGLRVSVFRAKGLRNAYFLEIVLRELEDKAAVVISTQITDNSAWNPDVVKEMLTAKFGEVVPDIEE